uniref:Uncharacterized protein n=1 Tax=Zea mays TaxID=4577 RepID=A0A804PXJ9_MAIZE
MLPPTVPAIPPQSPLVLKYGEEGKVVGRMNLATRQLCLLLKPVVRICGLLALDVSRNQLKQANNLADGGSSIKAGRAPSSMTRFFLDAERHKARQPPPTKLEEEEGATPPPPATEEEMAPHNIWQLPTLNSVAALVFVGKDLIVLAKTGSERTGAFALPILQELLSNREGATYQYLIDVLVFVGKDLIALVQTESGKMGTFMLPIL